jgi:hypothetical protein
MSCSSSPRRDRGAKKILAGITALSLASATHAATITFVVALDGQQEESSSGTPGRGDLDGAGTATLMIDDAANTISWNIKVQKPSTR